MAKKFPFTAEEMRSQLPMKTKTDYIENDGKDTVLTLRMRGLFLVEEPGPCVLIPVDEWKEMIAWVARHEQRAAPQQPADRPADGDGSVRARGGAR
jgi:hypothetical protein